MSEKIDFGQALEGIPKPVAKKAKPVPLPHTEPVAGKPVTLAGLTPRQTYAALAMQVFLDQDLKQAPALQLGAETVAERAVFMADTLISKLGD